MSRGMGYGLSPASEAATHDGYLEGGAGESSIMTK